MPSDYTDFDLPADLAAFVKAKVSGGEYKSYGDVYREALSAMVREESELEQKREKLRSEIQAGLDDVAAGRVEKLEDGDALRGMMDDAYNRAMARLDLENAELVG